MVYDSSLTLSNSGWCPPSDFMLWNPTYEQALQAVKDNIDYMLDNNIAAGAFYSPVGVHFNLCFDSNNHFVVMYG